MTAFFKSFIVAIILCCAHLSFSQLSNCNAFLKGNYLECGINWNGAFGSSTRPPAGYHADTLSDLYNSATCGGTAISDSALGFVTDPDKDGWHTGSPAYFGDFVLPGIPQEGWSYMTGGIQTDSWNHNAASSDSVSGTSIIGNQTYTDSAGIRQTKWQAVFGGIYITQVTTLDTGDLFVTVKIYIENTSLAPAEDVYYMRTINPHNDERLSHNMVTVMKIEHQLPDTFNRSAISARGTLHDNAFLLLSTQDVRATAFITRSDNLPTANTIDNIFAGDPAFDYGVGDSVTGNVSMGLVYSLGTLSSGNAAIFSFIYGFQKAVLASTTDTTIGIATIPHPAQAACSVFPNPTTGNFKITGLQTGDKVQLYDMTGREISNNLLPVNDLYSLSQVIQGIYILTITDANGMVRSRIKMQKS